MRCRQLGARLGGPSLPLDVGVSSDIPAAIRRAVILRDQHCRFPGGCDQPAAGCEVHHLTHKADGGKTSVTDCGLFCFFHHQIVIHQWGWTVVLNPDGTTTAWNKDKTKVLHSHGPPAGPGQHPPGTGPGGPRISRAGHGPAGDVTGTAHDDRAGAACAAPKLAAAKANTPPGSAPRRHARRGCASYVQVRRG